MLKIVHKYARRIIAWLNTPSEEELDARTQREIERQAERDACYRRNLRNRIIRAVAHHLLPGEYATLGLADLQYAITVINDRRDSGLCSSERAAERLEVITALVGQRVRKAA